jgi:two-component system, chemotaxis family, chemotaxis protein CheY
METSINPYPALLVVEDNMMTAKVMETNLEDLNHRIHVAEDGEDALHLLNSEPTIGLVITDFRMPRMDGLELLQAIKQSNELKAIPVVLCTGAGDPQTVKRAIEMGCADCLVKPINPAVLLERVSRLLKTLKQPVKRPADVRTEFGLSNRAYLAMTRTFVVQLETGIDRIAQQLTEESVCIDVDLHNLKESAVIMGAEQLGGALTELIDTSDGRPGSASAYSRLLREMKVLLETIKHQRELLLAEPSKRRVSQWG